MRGMWTALAREVVVTGSAEGSESDAGSSSALEGMNRRQAAGSFPSRSESSTADRFAEWTAPHLAVLTAVAVREVGRADAGDLVQETLVRAWRRRETYRPDLGTPRAWLIGILLDRCRRHRARTHRVELFGLRRGGNGTTLPDSDVSHGVLDVDMERAIAGLPRRQREVITLHYLARLTVVEMASVLGISTGSVKSHLHDARSGLRERLEES